jgi:regulator of protease activity HflC (stomatin/prohibitin superfamily)
MLFASEDIFMENFSMLLGVNLFVVMLVILAILTLLAGVKTVTQGYHWTVERFGRYTRTLNSGLNLIVPFFDRIGRKVNMISRSRMSSARTTPPSWWTGSHSSRCSTPPRRATR